MKKILLLAAAALMTATSASAIDALSESDLASIKTYKAEFVSEPQAAIKTNVAKMVDFSGTITASYVKGDNTQLKISNFLGRGYDVTATVDWKAATFTIPVSQVSSFTPSSLGGMSLGKVPVYVCDCYATAMAITTLTEVKKHPVNGNIGVSDPDNTGILTYTFAIKNLGLAQGNTSGQYLQFPAPIFLSFTAEKAPSTAVDDVTAARTVAAKRYINLQGQVSSQPFSGINVVETTYTDGTRSVAKQLVK